MGVGMLLQLQPAADEHLFLNGFAVHHSNTGLIAFLAMGVRLGLGLFAGLLRLAITRLGVGVSLSFLRAAGRQRIRIYHIALGGMGMALGSLHRLGFLPAAGQHLFGSITGIGVGMAGISRNGLYRFHRPALFFGADKLAVFVVAALAMAMARVGRDSLHRFYRPAFFLGADEDGNRPIAFLGMGMALNSLHRLTLLLAAGQLLVGLGIAIGSMGVRRGFLPAAGQRAGIALLRMGMGLELGQRANQFARLVAAVGIMGMYGIIRQATYWFGGQAAAWVAAFGMLMHRRAFQYAAGMLLGLAVQYKGCYNAGRYQQRQAEEQHKPALAALFIVQELCGLLHGRFHGICLLPVLVSNLGYPLPKKQKSSTGQARSMIRPITISLAIQPITELRLSMLVSRWSPITK